MWSYVKLHFIPWEGNCLLLAQTSIKITLRELRKLTSSNFGCYLQGRPKGIYCLLLTIDFASSSVLSSSSRPPAGQFQTQHSSTNILTILSFLISKREGERPCHCFVCILDSPINRIKFRWGALLFWQFFNHFLRPTPLCETKDCGKSSHTNLFGEKNKPHPFYCIEASGVFIRERKLWKPCGHLHKK